MNKSAIIIGASGLTGGLVLNQLLEDERYSKVIIIGRKTIDNLHPKIEEYIGDLLNLEQFSNVFEADEVYCCIGTTKKKTPNKKMYRNIDFGIPSRAAQLTKDKGIPTFCVVSAIGADASSLFFYNKTKGEMEQAVLKEKIEHTYILRPSIIGGKRNENRTGESLTISAFNLLKPILIGGLKKYRLIKAETIAKAMIMLANQKSEKNIFESDEIQKIAKN